MDAPELVSPGRPDIVRIALPPAPADDEWVSAREAARRANLEHVTVWEWARRGVIPSQRAGRIVLVPARRVEQLAGIWHQYGRGGRRIFRSGDPEHAYVPVACK